MTKRLNIYYLFGFLVAVYFCAFLSAPSHFVIKLNLLSKLEQLPLLLPYLIIWLVGFYGYDRLKSYGSRIKNSSDGKQINLIANGVLVLALWPPLSSILSVLTGATLVHPMGSTDRLIVIDAYFNIIWPFIGFWFVSLGARGLSELINLRASFKALNIVAAIVCVLGVLFTQSISYAYKRDPSNFNEPYWLVLSTLVVPYIYMWFLGMMATYYIFQYKRLSPGVVYRFGWINLSAGIGGVLLLSIILEFAYTLEIKFAKASLVSFMTLDFIFLILYAAAFGFIAKGAKQLKRIEDI
jgi:hypothetical protein